MTDRTLILHVGPHKTGTTAIQQALLAAQDGLHAAGWHFETFPEGPAGAHGIADHLNTGQTDRALETLATLDKSDRNLVISSENFSRLNEEQAAILTGALKQHVGRIRVVYYLRNPLDRLQSTWREWVKHGYRYSFVEFLGGRFLKPLNEPEINEMLKIAPWAAAVGAENLDLHVYDGIPDVAAHFLQTCFPGLAQPGTGGERKVNASLGLYKSEVYRALMGYQVWLSGNREFDADVTALSLALKATCLREGMTYQRRLDFSLNHMMLRRIEKNILDDFGAQITGLRQRGQIHEQRRGGWQYVASDVWLAEPELAQQVFGLRAKIHEKLGAPRLDLRLNRL